METPTLTLRLGFQCVTVVLWYILYNINNAIYCNRVSMSPLSQSKPVIVQMIDEHKKVTLSVH